MRKSISQKVAWGAGAILTAAVMAMCTTYFVSMSAIQALRQSHDLSKTVLTTTAALESDTVSGGLKVLQYLETGNPQHRQAYQQHSERIRQNADRLLMQSRMGEWKNTGLEITGKFKALDQISLNIMTSHESGVPASDKQRADVTKMLAMQEEAVDLINTRIRPKLKLITNEADNKAASGMVPR